jgi:WD40 repeat protein/Flp pilus assembly protein TadD
VTGKVRCEFTSPTRVARIAMTPDGGKVLTGGDDGTVRFWEADTGKAAGPVLYHSHPVTEIVVSPDGRRLLTAAGTYEYNRGAQADGRYLGEVRLWSLEGQLLQQLPHREKIDSACFSPDGQVVITSAGQLGKSFYLWEADTGRPLGPPVPAPPPGALNADGLVFQPLDLWGAAGGKPLARILPHPFDVTGLAFSPDGRTLLTGMGNGHIGNNPGIARLWDVATGLPAGPVMIQRGTGSTSDGLNTAVFSPDGRLVFTGAGAWDGTGRVWDAATGLPVSPPLVYEFGSSIYVAAFSPDSKTVAVGGYAKGHYRTVRMWDARTGADVGPPMRHEQEVKTLAFSPDGSLLLTDSVDQTARLWDAHTARPVGEPLRHKGAVNAVAFSPDGRTFLTASADGTAQLWDTATRRPLGPPLAHDDAITCAAYSPDGQAVATGSADHTARLWDPATGRPVGMPLRHQGAVRALAFGPDSRLVMTGSDDGTARLWDVAAGVPVGQPLEHDGKVTKVAFSPDGRLVATAGPDRAVRLWDVPAPVRGTPAQIALWVQTATGLELDAVGAVRKLDEPGLALRRRGLDRLGVPENAVPPFARGSEWHLRLAMSCLNNGQWFAAEWHLDRLLAAEPNNWSGYLLRSRARYQLGRADEDFARVYALRPDDTNLRLECARVHVAAGRWDRAADDFTAVVERRPDDPDLLMESGHAQAEAGRWARAADHFARADKVRKKDDNWPLYCHALACLAGDDLDGYRRDCARMLAESGGTTEPGVASRLLYASTARPDALADMAPLGRLGEKFAMAFRHDSTHYRYGAYYRTGRDDDLVQALKNAREPRAYELLFLAMSYQRLGRQGDAERCLADAVEWIGKAECGKTDLTLKAGPYWLNWRERVVVGSLLREAERSIQGR